MKRKPRKTLMKKNISLATPVNLTVVGTEADPCFGKHHDSLAPECQRCGDSEFCIIAKAHKLTNKRLKLESENTYKDLEEEGLQKINALKEHLPQATKVVKKFCKDGPQEQKLVVRKISKRLKVTKDEAKSILQMILNKSKTIKLQDGKIGRVG